MSRRYPVGRMTDAEDKRTHSIYFLEDVDGEILYIGVATDVVHRLYMHMHTSTMADSHWIQIGCTEHYSRVIGTKAQARDAEREAIAELAPWFNRQHNPARWRKEGAQWVPVDLAAREEQLWRIEDYWQMCRGFAA